MPLATLAHGYLVEDVQLEGTIYNPGFNLYSSIVNGSQLTLSDPAAQYDIMFAFQDNYFTTNDVHLPTGSYTYKYFIQGTGAIKNSSGVVTKFPVRTYGTTLFTLVVTR